MNGEIFRCFGKQDDVQKKTLVQRGSDRETTSAQSLWMMLRETTRLRSIWWGVTTAMGKQS